jgi:primase-polymerase (primpol)-like protein
MKKFETEFDGYHFPQEIKAIPQWVVCYADKIPMYSPGYQQPLEKASPTDPKSWMSFATAEHLCELNEGMLPGFVLTPDDPFTVIDMDVKDDTPSEHTQWFWQIAQGAGSYTEGSASGKGLHVWVYGNHGEGRRSSDYGIERYSQERFIICTGNVVINTPITDGRGVCEYLAQFLDEKAKIIIKVEDMPQVRTDEDVLNDILT